jgi:hypothetical protein
MKKEHHVVEARTWNNPGKLRPHRKWLMKNRGIR